MTQLGPDPSTTPAVPAPGRTAWRFDTAPLAPVARPAAWREALRRVRLPMSEQADQDPLTGSLCCLASPLGMEFAVMAATPQVIAGRNPDQPAAVWLVVLLEGDGRFFDGRETTALRPGDIVYGPTGLEAGLSLLTPSRVLFVNAPRVALDHRLIAPAPLHLGRFCGASGLGRVFSGLLRATADALADLTSDALRPVELAVTEFLLANLAADGSPASLGGAGAARSAHLHRLCQAIETRLSDPGLTLNQIARQDGISGRSLQKLFAWADTSFSSYVRDRRLERCRLDLTSPACAGLSISEIAFRWGFNGSAYFSRAFKERYGLSPRKHRRGGARGGEAPNPRSR